ncbi:MAG: gephyrin-like molybdotransferase Glp [Pseudaminobacter sp.]
MHSSTIRSQTRRPQTLAEARALIVSIHPRVTGIELVPVHKSNGRCLAEDIVAPVPLPQFDAAAMDGYAVRSADLDSDGRARLRVIEEIAAGHPWRQEVGQGEAARIYTGATLPPGADRIVPQEYCRRDGKLVTVAARTGGKPHIRMRGEDVLAGQRVLVAGTCLGPAQLALLTALQMKCVPVLQRLRVALLSTGDELSERNDPLKQGGIVDSNRPMLKGWLEKLGCIVEDLGIVPDSADTLLHRLVDAAATSDLIISSGGASVGPADHLARLIVRRGYLEFWKLAMRPGKPVGLGDIDDCPILALPGNPFAAATAFTLIGRTLIARLSGDKSADPAPLVLPLVRSVPTQGTRLQVLAGRFALSEGGATGAEPLEVQGSASLTALAGAQGLILLPGDRKSFAPGDPVQFVPI